ncbi:helix-turn-helix domain-containing protein [Kibdelosporangium persicum]|uniref:Helix-turn-helix transcriptional regulator n=1 Tax=Kibdelosporangium persicum TaxID=2698649 RepID=A0ABX2F1Y8_9PSEU|nr:helix-turn-helix domain-containing protein [Kibdelosporangium persicum]NRN65349.1 Helix-turn-helix transcriptional regulator [Kibdelosporangium persicum]
MSKPLRRDAQHNRDKLIAAAAAVFTERGIDAPLEEIARQAGVSIGTLYNRFPSRAALFDAVFPDRLANSLMFGDQALACEDPWDGFVLFVTRLCELQAGDRSLNDLITRRFPDATAVAEACGNGLDKATQVIDRAQRAGALRPDFTFADLVTLTWANARIVAATQDTAPTAWRRHLAFLLDGLRATAAHPVDEPPLTPEQLDAAMRA